MKTMTPAELSLVLEALTEAIAALDAQPVYVETKRGRVAIVPGSFLEDDGTAITAMAYNRETFVDRVTEKLTGGFREFYKARLAERELQARKDRRDGYQSPPLPKDLSALKWVDHWYMEAQNLLGDDLVSVLQHETKFKDRGKAANAAVAKFLQAKEPGRRTAAESAIKRDYGLGSLYAAVLDKDQQDAIEIVRESFRQAGLVLLHT